MVSAAKKDGVDADLAKYDGKWAIEEPTDQPLQGDLGLTLKVCSLLKQNRFGFNPKCLL